MQIIVQSLESSKPKILDATPLWVILSNTPLKDNLSNYVREHSVPNRYVMALEYLINIYCLNDSYSFNILQLDKLKRNYPFYKQFCYLNKFSFEKYEASKVSDTYQNWYHNELTQNVVSDYDYFYDLIVNDAYVNQLNFYYHGFVHYIKDIYSNEQKKYLRIRHILKKESDWLNFMKNSVTENPTGIKLVKSLNRYSIAVGLDLVKNVHASSKARAQIEKFIPAGMCFYDKYIFVNTYHYSSPYKALKNKINSKELFAHELGHAISFINQDILKRPFSRIRYCHEHPDLKVIIKKHGKIFQCINCLIFKKNTLNTL